MTHRFVSEYTVCALPPGHKDFYHFAITVAWRGEDRWAVVYLRDCLNRAGEWVWERRPSERDDEWRAEHRFSLEEALEMADVAALDIEVNGWTVEDVLHRDAEP